MTTTSLSQSVQTVSWTWDCCFKTLFSGFLSSWNPLKMQVSCRLSFLFVSFLRDLICSYGFNFHCYAGYSQICVSISALLSEFQATSPVTRWAYSFHRPSCACSIRAAGIGVVAQPLPSKTSHQINRTRGHKGLKLHASHSLYYTSLFLFLGSVFSVHITTRHLHALPSLPSSHPSLTKFCHFFLPGSVIAHDPTTSHWGHCSSLLASLSLDSASTQLPEVHFQNMSLIMPCLTTPPAF